MKVLLAVLSPLRPELGASQMALNLCSALRASGAEVVVWTPHPIPPEVHWWRRMGWMRRKIADYARRDGTFDVVDVPPVAVTASLARQCKVVARSVQPDLIYLWTELRHAGAKSLLRRAAEGLFSLYLAVLVVYGWYWAARIFCLGNAEFDWMRRWFPWWRSKMCVYMNALDDDERKQLAEVRRSRRAPPGPGIRFLWLGRWAAHKGVDVLLDFARSHLARRPADRITIAGCGTEAQHHIPSALVADGRVRLVPSYSRRELLELLANHDFGLFTSRAEGWGLTLQEMLESGMPVYATEAGAVRDLRDKFPDLLRAFPPPSPASAPVHASHELATDYFERFSWRAIAARYLEALRVMSAYPAGSLRLRLARAFAGLWRFRTLALATRAFERVASPCVLQRRFLGYRLHLDVSRSNAQRLLYLEGERFVPEAGVLQSLVRPGDVVVDVGANIGYYAILFAKAAGPAGRVVAFEPEPDNLIELRLNVKQNALRNADIRPCAVGARAGEVCFARGINGGVRDALPPGGPDAIRVPMVALDGALTGRVDMIKIDVEGYEGEVLAGARRTIERWRPNLFVEIHPALLTPPHTVDEILGLLQRHYPRIELYQPARRQSLGNKIVSRYTGRGSIERLPAQESVVALCRQGEQDTFWAVCRSNRRAEA